MRAAIALLRKQQPARIVVVVAVPVAPPSTFLLLRGEADEVVYVRTPDPFFVLSLWYKRFPQTSDENLLDLLERAEPAPSVFAHTG